MGGEGWKEVWEGQGTGGMEGKGRDASERGEKGKGREEGEVD